MKNLYLILIAALVISGCGSHRPKIGDSDMLSCDLKKYKVEDNIYHLWGTKNLLLSQDPTGSFNVLSLSAGGQFGAYGAGFLYGWGTVENATPSSRKDIQVVTGVSTGAIISTHAFLEKDEEIKKLYESMSNEDLIRKRLLIEYLWANSLFDTSRKDKLVDKFLTSEMITDVADKYKREKKLLIIGIVNLDSGEFWRIDMTKLASEIRDTNRRDKCYRSVVGASSSIPVGFAPKFIDSHMWVDGGARKHLFITDPGNIKQKTRRLFSIVHGDLTIGDNKTVSNGLIPIAKRTATLLIDESMKNSIRQQETLASKCPVNPNCKDGERLFSTFYATAVKAANDCQPQGENHEDDNFNTEFMKCLAKKGQQDGEDYANDRRKWLTYKDIYLESAPDKPTEIQLFQ